MTRVNSGIGERGLRRSAVGSERYVKAIALAASAPVEQGDRRWILVGVVLVALWAQILVNLG